jgi:hypothetical protein
MTRAGKLGVGLLVVGALAGLWSAFNPSFFTIRKFAAREGTDADRRDLRIGYCLFGISAAAVVVGTLLAFRSH